MVTRYTQVPRSTFWLMPEAEIEIGGETPDAQPRFRASVAPFYIGTTPITNEEYLAYDPSFRPHQHSPGPRHPAVGVSFEDALGYCAWYAQLSKKPIRLPTEVEWEYACRGTSTGRCFFGADADPYVWDAANSGGVAHEVEQKRRSPTGLYDMLGLVWEWTSSVYRSYPVIAGDRRDDLGAPGERVVRGGSYCTSREDLGCGVRRALAPSSRLADVGFRIVRSLA
jgi:formylglycine-generating enzyme required for sulfatase activity